MKVAVCKLVSAITLAFTACATNAESNCSPQLTFKDNGDIAEWSVCATACAVRTMVIGRNDFNLELTADGVSAGDFVQWSHFPAGDDATTYESVDTGQKVRIRRTYRSTGPDSLVQEISVTNLAGHAIGDLKLAFDLRKQEADSDKDTQSLADYIYGFHRVDVSADESSWQAPIAGQTFREFAVTSRHRSVVLRAGDSAGFEFTRRSFVDEPSPLSPGDWSVVLARGTLSAGETRTLNLTISTISTSVAAAKRAGLGGLIYADVPGPLSALCRWVESMLIWLSVYLHNLGVAIIAFAVITRLVTLPISRWAMRQHKEYKERFARAKPQIDKAKADFRGAEQSERILAIYKENNISPFSGLKGSVGLLVQIPFLLAVFNVTTRSSIFACQEFLWIADLANPDAAFGLPVVLPILGGYINALPLILGVTNVLSSIRDRDTVAAAKVVPIAISLLIVTVFYSFSAALVLYWLTINLLQSAEKALMQKFGPAPA